MIPEGIIEKAPPYILDAAQAREVMKTCVYRESEFQTWAIEKRLGVVIDSWYVPLVTASPELLLEFEQDV